MLCHVMLCHVMSCHVMLCHVMSRHVLTMSFCFEVLIYRTYVRNTGGTNIESDKRALNRENLDIIVGTPGTTHTHLLYMSLCWYVRTHVHACRHTRFQPWKKSHFHPFIYAALYHLRPSLPPHPQSHLDQSIYIWNFTSSAAALRHFITPPPNRVSNSIPFRAHDGPSPRDTRLLHEVLRSQNPSARRGW